MTTATGLVIPSNMRWARRGRVAVLGALANLALYNGYQVLHSVTQWPDFMYFDAFARSGLIYGYQHIYDPIVEATMYHSMFPSAPFFCCEVNPPPFAWLLAPLAAIPYPPALWIWTALMIGALAVSSQLFAPGGLYYRALFMLSWLGFLPAYLVAVSAPVAPLEILSLALTWKFIHADRKTAAGLALGIGLLKPTLVILAPVMLLAASQRRVFASWLVAAVALVVASCASLGPNGIVQFLVDGKNLAANPYSLRWSLVPFLGDGIAWVGVVVLIAAAMTWLAWRLRHEGPEAAIALGVTGSILINHHMTPGDLMMLLVPVWVMFRERGSLIRNAILCIAWVAAWLALIFPVTAILVAAGLPIVLFLRSLGPRDGQKNAARRAQTLSELGDASRSDSGATSPTTRPAS
jgi:hypothetical protein